LIGHKYSCKMFLEYKGTTIFYETSGKGKPILLLHGFLENSNMWNYIAEETFKGCQIVKIDLLGHGRTGCIGYVHTMEVMAEAVLNVIEKLKITEFKIIGHSMGGYVALALAELKPELISGICLMNSTFQADSAERRKIRRRAIEMAKTNYESLVRMSFLNLFSTKSREKFGDDIDSALKEALKTPIQGFIAAQEGMRKRVSRIGVIEHFNIKISMVLGTEDNLVNIAEVDKLTKNFNVKIYAISGGHMSHIENKEVLSYNLIQYIEN